MLMEESVEEHGLEKGDSSDVTTEMNEDSPSKKGNASWSEFYSVSIFIVSLSKELVMIVRLIYCDFFMTSFTWNDSLGKHWIL